MDEQMIRELALAIQRADDEKAPDSPLFPDDPEISDWGIHIARAAHSVMAGKVAELIEALRETRARWDDISTAEHERPGLRNFARVSADKIDAALAPYPERRSE